MEGLTSRQLIYNGIGQIFEGDKRKLDNALKGQGWRYFVAGLCILPITLLKVIVFMFENKHLFHRHKEVNCRPFTESEGLGLSMRQLKREAEMVYLSKMKSYNWEAYEKMSEFDEKYTKEDIKEKALLELQNIFNNNLYLKGEIIRITRNRVKDKDLLKSAETGKLTTAFITQRVTFGEEMNKLLKIVIPSLKHRKLKGTDTTYIVFENDELFELEQKLRNLFMVPVTVSVKKKAEPCS